jgi:hypothetical protein
VAEDRTNWAIIAGVAIGVLGGIVAGIAVHSMRTQKDSSSLKLRDAQDIILYCREKIKEIESGLEALKGPLTT